MKNVRELVKKFEDRLNAEIRRQEKINTIRKEEFQRMEVPEKYMARVLYGWDDGKFEKEYLRRLERNWGRWKLVSPKEKP